MASNIYDIITVGGGLGGASLAWTMVKHGARAFPLLAEDPTRLPDLLGLGPAMSIDETVRRRFFGEE